jgi:replicative DNA helicase
MNDTFHKYSELLTTCKTLEMELLGRIINSESLAPAALSLVNSHNFWSKKREFEIIKKAVEEDSNLSAALVDARVPVAELLTASMGSLRRIQTICRELKQASHAIAVYKILGDSTENVPSADVASFVADVQRKLTQTISEKSEHDIKRMMKEYKLTQEEYYERFKNNDGIIGLSTGYPKLDEVIDGLRAPHIWVINAYTSRGKTNALLNIIAELIRQGKRVVFFSLEMPDEQIITRLLGIMTNLSGMSILKGKHRSDPSVERAMKQIVDSGLTIIGDTSELSEIQFAMYAENMRNPVSLFAIDYIQLVHVKDAGSEYQAMTAVATELQHVAKRLNVPIIQLSQINNAGAADKSGEMINAKGSGGIGAAADLCIELRIGEENFDTWKRKMNAGEPVKMKWDIQKNRHGKVGVLEMEFSGKTGRFYTPTVDKLFDDF